MLIEVRGHLSVGVCAIDLTMVALVAVEIWGEVSSLWEIWWRSQWGGWYRVPGNPEWSYGHVTLLEVRKDYPAGVFSVDLTRFKLWAGKIWG
jgi:hypothetical protein